MSLNSWLAEFYPTPAYENVSDDLTATLHSLKKWEGVLPSSLAKHECKLLSMGYVQDIDSPGDQFSFDSDSCALCKRHDVECDKCPLTKYGRACGDEPSSWITFLEQNDPLPMLSLLRKVKDGLENE